jgi:purine-cytosine permease-like protein
MTAYVLFVGFVLTVCLLLTLGAVVEAITGRRDR